MFWTIVGALLFVFVVLPVALACVGAILAQFEELIDDITAAARWVGRAVQGVFRILRRPRRGSVRRIRRLV